MSKPTPRPWKIQKFRDDSRQPIGPDDFFTCAYVSGADNGEIQANAAHIVKCVNMHDELMEIINYLGDGVERNPNIYIAMDKAMRICDRLRKAEAE